MHDIFGIGVSLQLPFSFGSFNTLYANTSYFVFFPVSYICHLLVSPCVFSKTTYI